jgi:Ser/Thr protein kinase RdoA (MazF antagonist)
VDIARVIETSWAQSVLHFEPLTGGMNSETWLVVTDGGRFVLKSVDQTDLGFVRGLELAASLDRQGVTTGAPVLTIDGHLFQHIDDRSVALLRYVDGDPLKVAEPRSANVMGTLLARVHEAGAIEPGALETWLRVLPLWGDYMDLEPWIRPAVEEALRDIGTSPVASHLTWAGLHGDPSPGDFLVRGEDTALIDWGATMHGPALYDVASAAWFLGCAIGDATPESVRHALDRAHAGVELSGAQALVVAYLTGRPSMTDELCDGFALFLRLRWCVQAGYFAWRCAHDVRTGMPEQDWNDKGLLDARHALDGVP